MSRRKAEKQSAAAAQLVGMSAEWHARFATAMKAHKLHASKVDRVRAKCPATADTTKQCTCDPLNPILLQAGRLAAVVNGISMEEAAARKKVYDEFMHHALRAMTAKEKWRKSC